MRKAPPQRVILIGVWHVVFDSQRERRMPDMSKIKEHMKVIGADGVHVGTVDRRIGRYEPIDIFHAGVARSQDADWAAFGENAQRTWRANADTYLGTAGDHRLQCLGGALRTEIF